jgi:hypothetical protein
MAESLGTVKSEMIPFESGSGYGYEFAPGPAGNIAAGRIGAELNRYQNAIQWALGEFGDKSAAELELLTTIIYADCETTRLGRRMSFDELCNKVKEIKPRFPEHHVKESIKNLASKRLLTASF